MSLTRPWQLVGKHVVLFTGSRSLRNYWQFARDVRKALEHRSPKDTVLLQGESYFGIDRLARIFAKRNGWTCVGWKADWDNLGKRAGMVRNSQMVQHSDETIAGWDGVSRGTKHAIDQSKTKGLPIQILEYENVEEWEDRNIRDLARRQRLGDRARSKLTIKG